MVWMEGEHDVWSAYDYTETEALLKIQTRYSLGDRKLKLVRVCEDRRRHNDDKHNNDRRSA